MMVRRFGAAWGNPSVNTSNEPWTSHFLIFRILPCTTPLPAFFLDDASAFCGTKKVNGGKDVWIASHSTTWGRTRSKRGGTVHLVDSKDAAFVIGDHVELHGLKSAEKYNGEEGIVLSWMKEKGRYSVQLDDTQILVKPSNCRYLTEITRGIHRMNIDGGGTVCCPKSGQLVLLEWLDPATPQIDLGAANALICPTCRSDETNAPTKSAGEQECPVCYDTKECQALECGHAICDNCWETRKQVCLVGSGFIPPSLNMEEIEEERAEKHDEVKEWLPHTLRRCVGADG